MARASRPVAWFRRTGSEILGWTLIPLGIVLMPAPGPGTLVLVAGVALLAPHHPWAARVLKPLQRNAINAARAGVQTIPRITMSFLGGLWLFGLGVLWIVSPDIGVHTLGPITIGPKLPGAGVLTGGGIIASALAAWGLLAYSIVRWRGDPPEAHERTSSGRTSPAA